MQLEKLVNIGWYMNQKPYKVHSAYDVFYLQICRRLFSIINKMAAKHANKIELDEEECRALAYVATAYFEDEVNGFGFWQALVRLNQKQFGKRLPFFNQALIEKQKDESDDILPADIHYLLFVTYLSLASDRDEEGVFVFFENPFFHEAAEAIYDYLSGITEVEATDFYESYLLPGDDYIEFKKKLEWFVIHGYLTGVEFSLLIDNFLLRMKEERENTPMLSSFLYAEEDRLLFEEPSRLTAFFPVDIFAEALRCDEAKKEAIKLLKFRPRGVFQVQDASPECFIFLHTATHESFQVLKSSFGKHTDLSEYEHWMTTLAEWNGRHNISGLCLPVPMKAEELADYNLQHQHEFQRHYAPYRKQLLQTADEFRERAVRFFGGDFVTFPDGKTLEQTMNAFNEWYVEAVRDKKEKTGQTKAIKMELPSDFKKARDVSLFLPPHDNITFLQGHLQTLKTLQSTHPEDITLQERDMLLAMIADESADAAYWFYLRKNHPLPNLSFLLRSNVDSDEDFEALLRIYKPRDFSPLKLPRFTLFSSEEMPVEKVRDILKFRNQ